jgi:hypothetical protein
MSGHLPLVDGRACHKVSMTDLVSPVDARQIRSSTDRAAATAGVVRKIVAPSEPVGVTKTPSSCARSPDLRARGR